MNTLDALENVAKKIDSVLDTSTNLFAGLYSDAFLSGGKMLRARLLLDMAGDARGNGAVDAAAAVEILHAATLIHDDVLDSSSIRRNRPALHIKRGVAASVLYGDYLFSKAFLLMTAAESTFLYQELAQSMSEVLRGEIEEQSRRKDAAITEGEYISIIKMKTGRLFGLACVLGTMMNKKRRISAENARLLGTSVGTAYQILDDCGDYIGFDMTKEKFTDIKEGVVTLPLINLLKRCSKRERAWITKRIGRAFSPDEVDKMERLIEHYGAIDDCIESGKSMLADAEQYFSVAWIKERFNYMQNKLYAEGIRSSSCNAL